MKNKIKIGKPYVKEIDSDVLGKAVRLCAQITMENPNTKKNETKECYFEFEKRYKEYLCSERSDAFVMGLLSTAMENNMDIEFDAPISERLYYQLTNYYIPMISLNNKDYPLYNIKLIGPYDNTVIKNEGAVATGCSGGVDSFYTMLHHSEKCNTKSNKLTHIVYNSNATEDIDEDRLKRNYKEKLIQINQIAKECKLDTIACFNNLYNFYKVPFKAFIMFYTTTYGSVACALQKLLSIYYVSSGDPISKFNLNVSKNHGYSSAVFDVFSVQCINTENLTFYSSGVEVTRIEKEEYIADYEPAKKLLTVCAYNDYFKDKEKHKGKNCSICPKCLRTMSQFYALGKLENFKEVFNVEEFMKHKSKYLGKMMALTKKAYVHDMVKIAKKNSVKIPYTSYLYEYFWFKPIKILRKTFKNSKLARKIYYKFNLDYKLDGYRNPYYELYMKKIK